MQAGCQNAPTWGKPLASSAKAAAAGQQPGSQANPQPGCQIAANGPPGRNQHLAQAGCQLSPEYDRRPKNTDKHPIPETQQQAGQKQVILERPDVELRGGALLRRPA